VGVAAGAIYVRNAAGSLDLGAGQQGYVQDAQSMPVESSDAGRALALANAPPREADGESTPLSPEAAQALLEQGETLVAPPQTPEVAVVARDGTGDDVDLVTGGLAP
jgi:hypothetical protein